MQKYFNKITNYPGIYYIQSKNKTFNNKPDRSYYITYTNPNGKFIREKIGWLSEGYTPQIAVHIRGERLRKIRHGKDIPQKNKKELSFEQAWGLYDKWLDTGKKHQKEDRNRYKNHIKKRFASKSLSRITTEEIERFKANLIKKNLAPQSIKHILIIIRQIYNKMALWGHWKGINPIKGVKLPKIENQSERFLTHKEARQLLDKIKSRGIQTWEMSLLSLHTGMRAGEIFNLKWAHIDLDNGLIQVSDSKGSARKAFMTKKVKVIFQNKKKGNKGQYVFKARVHRKDKKIDHISRIFPDSVKKLGLNNGITDRRHRVSFHTLRHTFASWLALKSTPILEIKELLGHATLAMTERYAHLIPDKKRESVEKMEQAFLDDIE